MRTQMCHCIYNFVNEASSAKILYTKTIKKLIHKEHVWPLLVKDSATFNTLNQDIKMMFTVSLATDISGQQTYQ